LGYRKENRRKGVALALVANRRAKKGEKEIGRAGRALNGDGRGKATFPRE